MRGCGLPTFRIRAPAMRPPPNTSEPEGTERVAPPAPRDRLKLADYLIFGGVIALIVYAGYRVNDVLVYDWNWQRVFEFLVWTNKKTGALETGLLVKGLLMTLRLAVWATVLATIFGGVMGFWRTSGNLAFRLISRGYVELIRNIPPVVFIFVFYFFISSQIFPLLGLDAINEKSPFVTNDVYHVLFGDPHLLSNFLAGVLCLAMFEAAYITEIVRAGIQAVPWGQWEAARAIGLSRVNVLRDVILPQAVRKILPPLAGQFITLIKDSAIVSLISIQELTFLATEVAATTTKVFETWILVGAMYFVLCYSLAVIFARLERRAARSRH